MSKSDGGSRRRFDPRLYFDPSGAPRSGRFDDIYFQPGRGAAESSAVFVGGCGLPAGWKGRRRFAVGETGFGTGLNFLLTWDAWRQSASPAQRLHYVAVEGYPLSPPELRRALGPWDALAPLAARLQRRYGYLTRGFERLHFDRDRVTLTLLIGEAAEVLARLEAAIDAWYLDGFAPRRNPEMWSAAVFEQIARLSCDGARLATYTTAGAVRRGLEAVGFEVRKRPGFGAKRERLEAEFGGRPRSLCPAWAAPPPAIDERRPVTVLGGGVAGRSMARAFARRGVPVVLIDAGGGASRNPAVLVMPRLEAGSGNAGRLFWACFRYARRHWEDSGVWHQEGVLKLACDDVERDRQGRIVDHWAMHSGDARVVDACEASELAGLRLTDGGLWFGRAGRLQGWTPGAGTIPGVEANTARAASLKRGDEGWQPFDAAGRPLAPLAPTVLATGAESSLEVPGALPLQGWWGRATAIDATLASGRLRANLVCGRYLSAAHESPNGGLRHWLGASFVRDEAGVPIRPVDDADNLIALARAIPELSGLAGQPPLGHWQALRCASPDRMPVAGPLVDAVAFRNRFGWLRGGDRPPRNAPDPPPPTGLYALLALGARGFTSAPLLAEWLVSLMCRDPWPLERDLALAVSASRFLMRSLRRGTSAGPGASRPD